MIAFLRFVGILNASIWCGATIFLFIGVPAIFSDEVKRYLPEAYVGFPAQAVLARYYILHYCCSAIALAHLFIEWLYQGRSVHRRFTLSLLIGLAGIGLIAGLVLQPKLRELHLLKYGKYPGATVQTRAQASSDFKKWHVVSEISNLLVAGGLIVYLWRVTRSAENSRFVGLNKLRS
jgi:hypothetical protein